MEDNEEIAFLFAVLAFLGGATSAVVGLGYFLDDFKASFYLVLGIVLLMVSYRIFGANWR